MKDVKKENRKYWEKFLNSTKLSNIIAGMSFVVAVFSSCTANEAMQTVENNIEAANVGSVQTANEIINGGISVEDANYISKENDKEMMDKAYGAEDILKLVDENPNLSLCLIWKGSKEEYEATDWDKMPPNIKIEKYDEKTHTFTMTYN